MTSPRLCIEYLGIDAARPAQAGRLLGPHHGQGGVAVQEGGGVAGEGEGRGRDAVAVGGEVGRVDQHGPGAVVARHGGHGPVLGHGGHGRHAVVVRHARHHGPRLLLGWHGDPRPSPGLHPDCGQQTMTWHRWQHRCAQPGPLHTEPHTAAASGVNVFKYI